MRVLVVGCGYVGLPLGGELARRGHEVFGIRRTEAGAKELVASGVRPILADITKAGDLEGISGDFDWVVNTVASGRGGVDDYRAVYLEGTRALMRWLAGRGVAKYVYTSSTSVYGQTDGSWVSEGSPTEPESATSRVLVETEQLLLRGAQAHGFPAVVLRVAGIYGPGRGHFFQQYLRGEARLTEGGSRFMNMIHRDDVVAAVIAALERGRVGEVYNAVDDEPVTHRDFFSWLSAGLGGPMPPDAEEGADIARKRGLTDKRVSNRKLRHELECEFRHPTFRQGYGAEVARLRAEGKLVLGAYAR